ncbi:MAG: ArsI/CadI family heavy metal resistance metalloenzyme [Woeseia sp.]
MKRFHVNVAVTDLERSTEFYNTLFGVGPSVIKDDYAKWMLDDPRINFPISQSGASRGVNHIGLQADTMEELEAIQSRLSEARETVLDQPDAECCYARSSKTWVRDPDNVAWETFVTHGEITHFGTDRGPNEGPAAAGCCA